MTDSGSSPRDPYGLPTVVRPADRIIKVSACRILQLRKTWEQFGFNERDMQTIQTRERTGSDGALSLRIPLGHPDTEFDVVVIVQPKQGAESFELPQNYFALLGSIDDETFCTHPQPALPPPVEFE
ncbi:MAG: hypothetical protein JSS02_24420 [Planctomycetes bacterium]|nr:hypothetical protein [Planctomycetota bacterium]